MTSYKFLFLILWLLPTAIFATNSDCEHWQSQMCIDRICKHVGSTDCHQKCRSHVKAKCSAPNFDSKSQKKSENFDLYMDTAQQLNQCLERCSSSSDRSCSHRCRDKAKKSVKNSGR